MNINTFNDPILKKKCDSIHKFDNELKQLIIDMFYTMYNDDGVGLAAPQIGKSIKLFVTDHTANTDNKSPMIFINPNISFGEIKDIQDEGCLSFPGAIVKVERSIQINVEYQNLYAEHKELTANDWLARVIQHENDHLNGVTIGDKISNIEKSILRKKMKNKFVEKISKDNVKHILMKANIL